MKTTYQLTYDDAVNIWLRHWAGEFQHDIAAAYHVNQGRINEVLKEHLYLGSKKTGAQKRPAA